MFCARLFICASWSPAGKGLTSWLSFVVSSVSLSLSHWYPGSGWYLIVSIPDLCNLTYFEDVADLPVAVQQAIAEIPVNSYRECFIFSVKRCRKSGDCKGHYFEREWHYIVRQCAC